MAGLCRRFSTPNLLVLWTAAAALLLAACTDRQSTAIRATVETFFGAVQSDNLALAQDNLARDATPAFRERVAAAAIAAQRDSTVREAVRVVRVDQPVVRDVTASVRVNFANGKSDDVSLVREGLRWKVLRSGLLQ